MRNKKNIHAIEKLVETNPLIHTKQQRKHIHSLIRTHLFNIYMFLAITDQEYMKETEEDYCSNYCYGQTIGALTTFALGYNCTFK
jgi:hypothetical protein